MHQRLFLLLSLASPVFAQDGQQLFILYCSACHGVDGNGATGGAFPPLSESPWVVGDPDRAVKITLKGLTGPVDVLGKTYNLEMPPQGAVLPDDQLAAILTYVRSAWGNQAGPVTADQVKSIRASVTDRNTPWTSAEILKLHPLPLQTTALADLTSQAYQGTWSYVPDFKTLKAENIEEEHDGIISLTDSPYATDFGMVWEGKLEVPSTGDYIFHLDADDAGRLLIDGELIVELPGLGSLDGSRAQRSINKLTQGSHRLRAEYIQGNGQKGIVIGWRPSSRKTWSWFTDQTAKSQKPREPILIGPTDGRPVIYRNFIAGTTPRAIGVGFPGGLNLAYSADNLAPELLWTGNFIDAAAKWIDRGTDNSPPAGEDIVQLFKTRVLPETAKFKGYNLDTDGNPTFHIRIGEQNLADSWKPGESKTLVRTLLLTGGTAPMDYLLTNLPTGDSLMLGTDSVPIEISHEKARVKLTPGQPVTLTYNWK